jgi:hypothetical protein
MSPKPHVLKRWLQLVELVSEVLETLGVGTLLEEVGYWGSVLGGPLRVSLCFLAAINCETLLYHCTLTGRGAQIAFAEKD